MQELFRIQFDVHYDVDDSDMRGQLNAVKLILEIENQTDEKIWKPDVVAICTNYTDRIQLNPWINAHKNVAFVQNDIVCNPKGDDRINKKRGQDIPFHAQMLQQVRKLVKEGCVGLVDFDMKNLHKFVDALGALEYCCFCDAANMDSIDWYKTDDGFVVALVCVNTESG